MFVTVSSIEEVHVTYSCKNYGMPFVSSHVMCEEFVPKLFVVKYFAVMTNVMVLNVCEWNVRFEEERGGSSESYGIVEEDCTRTG